MRGFTWPVKQRGAAGGVDVGREGGEESKSVESAPGRWDGTRGTDTGTWGYGGAGHGDTDMGHGDGTEGWRGLKGRMEPESVRQEPRGAALELRLGGCFFFFLRMYMCLHS